MREFILTDADGCLLDWIGGFNQWMADKGYEIVTERGGEYTVDKLYGVDGAQAMKWVHEFNASDAIGNLGPCKDSLKWVKELAEHDYKFIVITSMGKQPHLQELRWNNLEDLFGPVFKELIILDIHADKAPTLKLYDDTIWVEDHHHNAHAGAIHGHETYLIDYAYNRKDGLSDEIIRVKNWKQIHDSIYTRHVQPHL